MDSSVIKKIISCIDLTSLNDDDTETSIRKLIQTANQSTNSNPVAAICVYPKFADLIVKDTDQKIRTALVGPSFPDGKMNAQTRSEALKSSNFKVVDEVDIVADPDLANAEKWNDYGEQIQSARTVLPDKTLKVIIESGKLKNDQIVRRATQICLEQKADFVKTSTGKFSVGFTQNAFRSICNEVHLHHRKTGTKVGVKASGGIRNHDQALEVCSILKAELSAEWFCSELFRIGASSLYGKLIEAMK